MPNLSDILADEGYVIKTFSSPGDIFKFLEGIRGGEGGSLEDEDPAMKLAESMTSKQAMTFCIAALLGSGRAFADGNHDCGEHKMEASAVWHAIHESLVRQEEREAQLKPEQPEDPNLGLANTRKLLEELEFRFSAATPNEEARNDIRSMLHQMDRDTLEYRSVDGEDASSGSETGQVS